MAQLLDEAVHLPEMAEEAHYWDARAGVFDDALQGSRSDKQTPVTVRAFRKRHHAKQRIHELLKLVVDESLRRRWRSLGV